VFTFEVEYGKNRQFQTGICVPIGLIETIRIEVLLFSRRECTE
jgi:hypothetical protein